MTTIPAPLAPSGPLPPGQRGLPLIGETLAFLRSSSEFIAARRRRYGRIFRTQLFGNPTVALVGSEANRFILSDGMQHFSWREGWPSNFHNLLGRSLFLQDGEEHRNRRNLLMPAFHSKALAGYLTVVEERLLESLDRWKRLQRFAWYDEFRRLTFEMASVLFLGSDLGPDLERLTQRVSEWTGGLIALPIPLPFTPYGRALRAREELLEYLDRAVQQRIERPTTDALSLLVQSRDENGNGLSREELKAQALLLVAAGHESTTSLLTSLFQVLATHPDILEKARAEQLALGILGSVTLDHVKQMNYLEQVMREVERCYPTAGFAFRGVVEPFNFGGYSVPRGWKVLYSIEATHHDPDEFPDPERFDPDRFPVTRGEPEERKNFKLVGFGGGPRICIGMTMAKVQIKIIASHLLRGYSWELEPGQDLSAQMSPLRRPKDGLRVRFRRR